MVRINSIGPLVQSVWFFNARRHCGAARSPRRNRIVLQELHAALERGLLRVTAGNCGSYRVRKLQTQSAAKILRVTSPAYARKGPQTEKPVTRVVPSLRPH